MDVGEFRAGNAAGAFEFLDLFDSIFDVLMPNAYSSGLAASDVEKLIKERSDAKKSRNFARADEIRKQLADQGVVLEDTKEGVRWKRQ